MRRIQLALICVALLYPISGLACYVNVYGESLGAVEAEVAKPNVKVRLKSSDIAQVIDLVARAKKGADWDALMQATKILGLPTPSPPQASGGPPNTRC